MFISNSSKLIFLAPQKTGTRSVYEIMKKYYNGRPLEEHGENIPDRDKKSHYTTFITARNPYDRIISLWWSMCKREGDRYEYKKLMQDKKLDNRPESFLKVLKPRESRTQADYHKENRIDYIIHTENLEEEFKQLPFYKPEIEFPCINTTSDVRPLTKDLINDEYINLINNMYKEDFDLLGYEMIKNYGKKFAILTPSRGRPGRLDNFLKSVHNSATNKERVFTYNYIDEDDPRLIAYNDYNKNIKNNDITIGPAQSVSKSWNIIAQKAIDNGADVLIMGNDDMMYRTSGWDLILEEEIKKFPDNIYCMWFEDLINGNKHCSFPIISKTWYNTLEYFTPGVFNFGYNDTWVFDIAKRINRTHFISNVINEHLHWATGKAPADETTARNRSQERGNLYEKDKVIFNKTKEDRAKAALLLLEMIDGPHEKY